MNDPAHLSWARGELGTAETPGPVSTRRILEYRKISGCTLGGDDGAVPWCAIFVNAALAMAGLKGSGNAMARGFLKYGQRLMLPAKGAIVVFSSSRGPASGHVGFYVGETATHIRVLGGNQGDAVSIASFPKARVLGYRWPAKLALPTEVGPIVSGAAAPSAPVRDA